jgi:FkbM family methyltransferase
MSEAESWLLHLVPDTGELALDVGANEGSFTSLLAGRFDEVHAFDPNPQITPTLRKRANVCRNVRVIELAVYREPAVLTLRLYPSSEHATAYPQLEVMARGAAGGEVRVPASSLDLLGYPDQEQVDFVKIDVEGGEADVLAGAKDTLLDHRPQLLIEIHNLDNLDYCRRFLAGCGYEVEHIPHPHPGVHPGHCWLSAVAAVAAQKGAWSGQVSADKGQHCG